jgi:hypothetical protein
MASLTSLSTVPPAQSQKIEWCFLFLEHLEEFETLALHLVADSKGGECVILPTLTRLDSNLSANSVPLLTYNQARDTLITQAIAALRPGHDRHHEGPMLVERLSLCELLDLARLAFLLELVLRSSATEVAKFFDVSAFLVPELVQYVIDRLGQGQLPSVGTECYDA